MSLLHPGQSIERYAYGISRFPKTHAPSFPLGRDKATEVTKL